MITIVYQLGDRDELNQRAIEVQEARDQGVTAIGLAGEVSTVFNGRRRLNLSPELLTLLQQELELGVNQSHLDASVIDLRIVNVV